jgi:undecaprenyl diphosphate synthase
MRLFVQYLEVEMKDLADAGVRLRMVGDIAGFAPELQLRIKAAESATASNKQITLCVAANYGGRWDILQAIKGWQIANPRAGIDELTEAALTSHLSTAGLPEVDLLVRTGGERRVSNFLLWQCAYAELYFTDVLWPDFGVNELEIAFNWFAQRKRRFGMTSEQLERRNVA